MAILKYYDHLYLKRVNFIIHIKYYKLKNRSVQPIHRSTKTNPIWWVGSIFMGSWAGCKSV